MVSERYAGDGGQLFLSGRWCVPPSDVVAAMQKLPEKVRRSAQREWSALANRSGFAAEMMGTPADTREAAASDFVRRMAAPFLRLPRGLDVQASEENIAEFAEQTAQRFFDAAGRGADWVSLLSRCPALGLDTEKVFAAQLAVLRKTAAGDAAAQTARAQAVAGIVRRLQDKLFWRRHFRRLIVAVLETAMRETGWVSRRAGLYASQETVFRRRSQKRRNAALLAAMAAVNELGQEYTLAELSEKSVSNPALRRAELMTRIAGFETIARASCHAGEFVTLTCPSRFHRMLHKGGRNPKFDGSSPDQAAAYLQTVWARIRAELGRKGIKVYGFRVAEPHHDGTPHWHMLLFMPQADVLAFRRTVARHGCRADREELNLNYYENRCERRAKARQIQTAVLAQSGEKKTLEAIEKNMLLEADYWAQATFKNWKSRAASRRVDFTGINWKKGSAAGYIAKYIAKNIDGKTQTGEALGEDFEAADGASAAETAERVDTWASAWRVRQFQQIGGAPVGVWRELRRLDPDKLIGDDTLMLAARAADQGDWAKFCLLMGGIETARADMPLTLYKENNGQPNRYGEPAADTVRGIIDRETGEYRISRIHEWQIAQRGEAAPWTGVNNCTEFKKPSESIVFTPEQIAETLAACEPIDRIISFDALHPESWDFDFGDEDTSLLTPARQQAAIAAAQAEAQAERARSDELAAYRRHLALLEALQLDKPAKRTRRRFARPTPPPRYLPLPGAKGKTPADVLTAGEVLLAEIRRETAAAAPYVWQ